MVENTTTHTMQEENGNSSHFAILVLVCNQLDFETSMVLSELDSIND